ncbi:MAG: fumarylacetoacetase [Afipia sp.]|nr:fumarylacetoacetase [Afipia sp.]
MIDGLDETHDASRRSFVASANDPDGDFPIQNLPLGIFSRGPNGRRGVGVAIGDRIFDLAGARHAGLIRSVSGDAIGQDSLNALFALGNQQLRLLRKEVSRLLDEDPAGQATRDALAKCLVPMSECTMHRPTDVANYTDFYAGIHHARAAGALLTPENPLPANYKWVPIAYHGRASSVQAGGGEVRRPLGQRPPLQAGGAPSFGACERLDFELEIGFYVSGGNALGDPVPISGAASHIAGYSLLNDWSARDVQRWEMFPLGPFLSKSFATSVSPWVVTADALMPFRTAAMPRGDGDPKPLPYLWNDDDQANGGLNIDLEVSLSTAKMRKANEREVRILTSNARYLYWTPAQMVAHHTINGCNLKAGDLIGTGTISGPSDAELSSMLEFTKGGTQPVTLPNGEKRSFLLDGDRITFRGRCRCDGFSSIGFGLCVGTIISERQTPN